MSDPSIPRHRGRPTKQEQAERQEQERIQSALHRRQGRARKILARTDVQELLTIWRQELGIPTGGFGSDAPSRMAWYEEATASQYAELERDAAAQNAVGRALEATDVAWPAHWTITSLRPTPELLLYRHAHTLKLICNLDDTWHAWAMNIIMRGEAETIVTLPGTDERTPDLLFTGAAGQITRIAHRPAVDPNDRPQTSRAAIYVDDDMEPEDVPRILEAIRKDQGRPLYQEEATRPAPPLTEFALSLKLHRDKGNSWRSWQDTPDGQRFIVQMDLCDLDREHRHTVILGTLKPLLPGQVMEAEDGTAMGVPLRNYWPKMTR